MTVIYEQTMVSEESYGQVWMYSRRNTLTLSLSAQPSGCKKKVTTCNSVDAVSRIVRHLHQTRKNIERFSDRWDTLFRSGWRYTREILNGVRSGYIMNELPLRGLSYIRRRQMEVWTIHEGVSRYRVHVIQRLRK